MEAALAGGLGSVLGLGLFFVLRPFAAVGVVGGLRWLLQDLGPSPGMAVVLVLVVPLVAAAGAALSLRAVVTSPLGVARQARRRTPGAGRMVVLLVGLGSCCSARRPGPLSPDRQTQLAAISFVAIVVRIMVLGAWLTAHRIGGVARCNVSDGEVVVAGKPDVPVVAVGTLPMVGVRDPGHRHRSPDDGDHQVTNIGIRALREG